MSDHEGEGLDLDRWEEASLPGDSVFSYARSDVFNHGMVTGNAKFYSPTGSAHHFDPRRGPPSRPPNGFFLNGFHAPQQTAVVGQPRRDVMPSRQIPTILPPAKSPARVQFENGQPPNGEYKFASNWRLHRAMAFRINRAAQPHPIQVLRDIMVKHGGFIKRPEDDDDRLFIWGEPHQVAETKAALGRWERDIREAPLEAKPVIWAKNGALDGRAENRAERQTRQKAFEQILRDAQIDYPVEAALLWPKDLDLEQFETDHADVLDQLRSTFGCRITFLPSGTQHIMIGAKSKKDALSLMSRMMNLIKETISSRDQLLTINLVHLPDHEMSRDRVGLRDIDPKSGTYLPTLHGIPQADKEEWDQKRRQAHIDNRKKIQKAIDSSIKGLRVSQQHVRMRVVFGELGFMRFQKPTDGGEHYEFDDFYHMVTKGRTKLTLNGLPIRQGNVIDLPDVLESMGVFSERTEYYGAFFDFQGTSPNTILRLETVFSPHGTDETESREKRWVELGEAVSRLQVSLVNFGVPDYQVTLDAFPLRTDKSTKVHMSSFQANVTMERPRDGIKSLPRRRARYPPGQPKLQRVAELITLRWRFKNTDGVFELRRKDIYDELPGRESPAPVETKWHALYFYPHWDNLMGEFASVKPGEDIRWVKSVATFIPEGGDQYGPALPKGFKNFINEVEEIQDLLADAIHRLEKVNGKLKATDVN
ncbi:uncharacterized protein PV07_00748 [Cladophialophora immunda]|uniref:DUF7905 domain-containing protein n=1 Tax=Cladophialophora immunda TaxID=569365 RepID=A0A0D2DE20_9EURO|nr:uncharacterized protein PV07_00748 [Cladophialophora immunda]KIW33934.1 hypothetical protein PV07_00748 [Cladophialophora immunda]OQU94499.1 hypothetical protein CLAIMM_00851 [Cladophialophora immunda]